VIAGSATVDAPDARWVPVWAAPATLALVGAGLAVSIYLTITHFTTHVKLACSASGVIDCEKVTTSSQSYVAGIPVAVLGVVYFVIAAGLCLPVAWRTRAPAVRTARVVWAAAGVAMVVWLVYAELFEIDAICLWCTVVHVITVVLFATILLVEALIVQHEAASG
jgi:uncharacterized membrane protein